MADSLDSLQHYTSAPRAPTPPSIDSSVGGGGDVGKKAYTGMFDIGCQLPPSHTHPRTSDTILLPATFVPASMSVGGAPTATAGPPSAPAAGHSGVAVALAKHHFGSLSLGFGGAPDPHEANQHHPHANNSNSSNTTGKHTPLSAPFNFAENGCFVHLQRTGGTPLAPGTPRTPVLAALAPTTAHADPTLLPDHFAGERDPTPPESGNTSSGCGKQETAANPARKPRWTTNATSTNQTFATGSSAEAAAAAAATFDGVGSSPAPEPVSTHFHRSCSIPIACGTVGGVGGGVGGGGGGGGGLTNSPLFAGFTPINGHSPPVADLSQFVITGTTPPTPLHGSLLGSHGISSFSHPAGGGGLNNASNNSAAHIGEPSVRFSANTSTTGGTGVATTASAGGGGGSLPVTPPHIIFPFVASSSEGLRDGGGGDAVGRGAKMPFFPSTPPLWDAGTAPLMHVAPPFLPGGTPPTAALLAGHGAAATAATTTTTTATGGARTAGGEPGTPTTPSFAYIPASSSGVPTSPTIMAAPAPMSADGGEPFFDPSQAQAQQGERGSNAQEAGTPPFGGYYVPAMTLMGCTPPSPAFPATFHQHLQKQAPAHTTSGTFPSGSAAPAASGASGSGASSGGGGGQTYNNNHSPNSSIGSGVLPSRPGAAPITHVRCAEVTSAGSHGSNSHGTNSPPMLPRRSPPQLATAAVAKVDTVEDVKKGDCPTAPPSTREAELATEEGPVDGSDDHHAAPATCGICLLGEEDASEDSGADETPKVAPTPAPPPPPPPQRAGGGRGGRAVSGFAVRSGSPLVELDCGHCYHVNCIQRWLLQDAHCPICRRKLC